jgi:hypothetical protein
MKELPFCLCVLTDSQMEKHNGLELMQQRVIYDEAAQPSTNHMKFQKKKLPREEQLEKKKKLEFLGEEQC